MARGTLLIVPLLLAVLASCILAQQPSRRVRVRTRPVAQQEPEEAEARSVDSPLQLQYYAVQDQEEEEPAPRPVVVVQPRRLYASQLSRADDEFRRPTQRINATPGPRTKDTRAPPIQTIRNYNTINDDGSFTFGYEAADGSFKEETRGTDCVVRGKYGYVDPDGNKREFTYVSGNPCDPNNPEPEQDDRDLEEDEEENVPVRPHRPLRPTPPARRPAQPAQTVFQNNYLHGQRVQQAKAIDAPIAITPRPQSVYRTTQLPELPATTYRPKIQNYPTTPQQTAFYAVQSTRGHLPTTPATVDFDEELKKFQLELNAPLRPTPTPKTRPSSQNVLQPQQFKPAVQQPLRAAAGVTQRPATSTGVNPYYSSQLVYDPATGQYNTVLYQNLPKGAGDFSLNHRLQAYVQPQQQYPYQHQQPQVYRQPAASPTPHYGPQTFSRPTPSQGAQSFYYVNPNLRNQFTSNSQIDDFLRGHNIQF